MTAGPGIVPRGGPIEEEEDMPQSRWLTVAAVIVGIALIVVGVIYWAEPAHSLPGFFPGHDSGSNHHHVKHGIAAFLLGIAVLAFAWFQSAPRKTKTAA